MSINKIFLLFLAAMAGIIGLKYFSPHDETIKAFHEKEVILAFGDSLTYGYGAPSDQSYPAHLERLLHRRVINAGVSGELSEEGLKRLPELLQTTHPDLLILCHGGNDILRKKSAEELLGNLEQMIVLAKSQGIEVILIAVPEFGLLQLTPPALYRDLAQKHNLLIEEDILPDILHDNRYKSDLIHPNASGYQKMGESIALLLRTRYAFENALKD